MKNIFLFFLVFFYVEVFAASYPVPLPGTSGNVMTSNGTRWTSAANVAALSASSEFLNCGIAASISSNTLVVALKDSSAADPSVGSPCKVGFRNTTATTGNYTEISITAATSITLAAADSIGSATSSASAVQVYLVDGSSADEVCLSQTVFNEGILTSASALTGSADTSATTLWCPSAHSSRPIRWIGTIHATWSNPNWGSITDASVRPQTRPTMYQLFTGSSSWVAPKGVTNAVVCGRGGSGGGGGGSGTGGSGAAKGGMGAAGSVTSCRLTSVSPGTSYTVTIGGAGTGGTGNSASAGTDGSNGGDTTFGSLLTFKGSSGGAGATTADQRTPAIIVGYGFGSAGTIGGFGGTSAAGSSGGQASAFASGGGSAGGDTYDGGGGGGGDGSGGVGGNANGGSGGAGTSGGGGGGGAGSSTGSAGNGGAGTAGQLEVFWSP